MPRFSSLAVPSMCRAPCFLWPFSARIRVMDRVRVSDGRFALQATGDHRSQKHWCKESAIILLIIVPMLRRLEQFDRSRIGTILCKISSDSLHRSVFENGCPTVAQMSVKNSHLSLSRCYIITRILKRTVLQVDSMQLQTFR